MRACDARLLMWFACPWCCVHVPTALPCSSAVASGADKRQALHATTTEWLARTLTALRQCQALRTPGSLIGTQLTFPRLHVLAHSRGNRVILQALLRALDLHTPALGQPLIGELIMASSEAEPTPGAYPFLQNQRAVVQLAFGVTHYFNPRDTALEVAAWLGGKTRMGKVCDCSDALSTPGCALQPLLAQHLRVTCVLLGLP